MGYDVIMFRTPEKEIKVEEKLFFREGYSREKGRIEIPDTRKEVKAKEVLWLHKAYWLGNIIEEKGKDAGAFLYLSKEDMEDILMKSKEVLNKRAEWLFKRYFNIGYLTSYEEMVMWEQLAHFNRVMGNLLRNENEVHYWYLKP